MKSYIEGTSLPTLILLATALTASLEANSKPTEFGIGLSLKPNDNSLYIPLKMDSDLVIEPFISFSRTDTSSGTVDTESQSILLGLGAFKYHKVMDEAQYYWGGRIAYLNNSYDSSVNDNEVDGLMLSPVLGLTYELSTKMSISTEVTFEYTTVDGDNIDSSTYRVNNNLLFRYHF